MYDEELMDIIESALDPVMESVDSEIEDNIDVEEDLLNGIDLDIPILDDEEEIIEVIGQDISDEELEELEDEADDYADEYDDEDNDIDEISDDEIVDENCILSYNF